ncbi:MAG: hypothetical protein M0Z67_04830 [Nitrospiraceae bacterium]|nr:hypothetical protein [Nitrospiraceae bacterium]
MIQRLFISFTFILVLFSAATFVSAADSPKDTLLGHNGKEKEVCGLIKDNLQRGVGAKAVTKTNIRLGNEVCYVVRCAIDGGGELKLIIAGAVEAGATPDVVSKCCVEAGAEPAKIAEVLQGMGEGLGYSLPGDQFVPMDTATVGRNAGTRFVSPSSF